MSTLFATFALCVSLCVVAAEPPSITTTDDNGLLLAAEGPILIGTISQYGTVSSTELVPKADLDAALDRVAALEPLTDTVAKLTDTLVKVESVLDAFGVKFNETDASFTTAEGAALEFQESIGDFVDKQFKAAAATYITTPTADKAYAPQATVTSQFTAINERLVQLQDLVEKNAGEKLPRCPKPNDPDNGTVESQYKGAEGHPEVPFVPGVTIHYECEPGFGIKGAAYGSDERSYERVCYADGTWASVADKSKFVGDAVCEKCNAKPFVDIDVSQHYRNTQGARWGRDFRSGGPGETTYWTVGPLDVAGFKGIKFEYEYVFGYSGLCGWSKTTGFKDCSQYPDDTWPEMKVFVMNGDNSEDARIQMYSSGPLQNYPYDNCNLNGGWGDQATKNDGCYSPAVKVLAERNTDTGVWSFNEKAEGEPGPVDATSRDVAYNAPGDDGAWLEKATSINIVFEFNNNRKNMHLNPHHMDMQVAGALFDTKNRACKKD